MSEEIPATPTAPPIIQPTSYPSPRPTAITVICVVGFIGFTGVFLVVPLMYSVLARRFGELYPPYLVFIAAVAFISMIGLWKMRQWAVFTYIGVCALNLIVTLGVGTLHVSSLVVPGIFIAIMFAHFSKMR